jgi:hypothetical protein
MLARCAGTDDLIDILTRCILASIVVDSTLE